MTNWAPAGLQLAPVGFRWADGCNWDIGALDNPDLPMGGWECEKIIFLRYFCNFLSEIDFIFLRVLADILLGFPTLWSPAIA